jgi:4-carboxymuconolactone decarboxylase
MRVTAVEVVALALLLVQAGAATAQTRTGAPRLAPLPESEWTSVEREVVASWPSSAAVPNDVRTYLRHPVLAKNLLPFERYITDKSALAPRERALLILRTAWLCRSQYVWARHAVAARAAGLGDEDLTRIARGPAATGWSPFDAALLRAADELHVSSFVNDDTWRLLAARYDTPRMLDALFTVAEFTMVAGTVNSLGVQVEAGLHDRLPSVPYAVATARNDERLIGKTARVLPLEPAAWSPEVRQWLDRTGSGRPVAGIYRTYAHHLPMDQPRTLVSEHIRQTSTLTSRVRELLIMRIGWLCRSEYEWAAHAPAGRRAGMTPAEVDRVIAGPDAPGDAFEGALLRAVDELHRDDVISDATWAALAARYDAKQLLDVLTTIGGYRMVSMALNSLGVQLEANAERFPTPAAR